MSIIEKEIQKRENLINGLEEKRNTIAQLEAQIITLKNELESVNVAELVAEIEELKTYLPVVEVVEPLTDDVVA